MILKPLTFSSSRISLPFLGIVVLSSLPLNISLILYSECQKRIPFVLLVNIATTIDGFQTQLPTSTLSLLKTERFRLCASDKVINGLTEQLFLRSHSSVKLDSKSLNSLLNEYALYDLSVTAFLNGVKVRAMLLHEPSFTYVATSTLQWYITTPLHWALFSQLIHQIRRATPWLILSRRAIWICYAVSLLLKSGFASLVT